MAHSNRNEELPEVASTQEDAANQAPHESSGVITTTLWDLVEALQDVADEYADDRREADHLVALTLLRTRERISAPAAERDRKAA